MYSQRRNCLVSYTKVSKDLKATMSQKIPDPVLPNSSNVVRERITKKAISNYDSDIDVPRPPLDSLNLPFPPTNPCKSSRTFLITKNSS